MTDITELAQSLKAAITEATPGGWYVDYDFDVCTEGCGFIAETHGNNLVHNAQYIALANPANILALVEALEKAQQLNATQCQYFEGVIADGSKRIAELDTVLEREREKSRRVMSRIAELESRTVKLPDGWQFEECEIEGCENGAIFSVGTGSRNIHLCDKCAHEPQNSRLKKTPLSKRLPFKMSAGIKVEAE
ncbi:TPA: hypothetical protein ACQ7FF_004689 [Klebsiella pneumoniae]